MRHNEMATYNHNEMATYNQIVIPHEHTFHCRIFPAY